MSKYKEFEPLLIEWVDSHHMGGWIDLRESDFDDEDDLHIATVGFFVHEAQNSLIVVQSRKTRGNYGDAIMTIPLVAITKVTRFPETLSNGKGLGKA